MDLLDYIISGKKRFGSNTWIEKKVPYHMIDKLKTTKFIDVYNQLKNRISNIEQLYKIYKKNPDPNISLNEYYKLIHKSFPYLIPKLQNLILLTYPINSQQPWHFYYVFKPYEYLYENHYIQFIPVMTSEKIEDLIKNLEEEVKFIHQNKFRQIML